MLTGPQEDVVPNDMYRRLALDARRNARFVVADLSGGRLEAALEGGVDLLKVSDEELESDGRLSKAGSLTAAIDALVSGWCRQRRGDPRPSADPCVHQRAASAREPSDARSRRSRACVHRAGCDDRSVRPTTRCRAVGHQHRADHRTCGAALGHGGRRTDGRDDGSSRGRVLDRSRQPIHWETATGVAEQLLASIVDGAGQLVLNVNVPNVAPQDLTGMRAAHLATVGAVQAVLTETGELDYEALGGELEPGTDVAVLADGAASVTALRAVCEAADVDVEGMLEALTRIAT